jgi:hypothetical protein
MTGKVEGNQGDAAEGLSQVNEGISNSTSLSELADSHLKAYDGFNPEVHAIDPATGEPKKTASGAFAKRRGRKPGQALPAPAGINAPGGELARVDAPPVVNKQDAEMAARTSSNLLFYAGESLFGDEWVPDADDLRQIPKAFTDYYCARGIPNIPPEIGLLVAIVGYAAPRLKKPKTKAKIVQYRNMLTGKANDADPVA